MALIFPCNEDIFKSRAYLQAEKEGLNGRDYIKRAKDLYNEIIYERLKFKNYTLEDKLIELAIDWKKAGEKEKKKIDKIAFKLIKKCCRKNKKFTSLTRDYYRIYRNIKKNTPFYIV